MTGSADSNSDVLTEEDVLQARARHLALAGLVCALGMVLPVLFHAVGLGRTFLPMHLPILWGGLLLPPGLASLAGLLTPWASMLLTGMPPLPMAVIMSAELAVLGGSASVLRRMGAPAAVAAWLAIVLRVMVTLVLTVALARMLNLPPAGVGIASVAAGLPGIVLQAVLVPAAAAPFGRARASHTGDTDTH